MHSLEQAEVESSQMEDSVVPVEEEVRRSLERAAFLLGRVRRPSVIVRYSELCPHGPPYPRRHVSSCPLPLLALPIDLLM
jgi:hypothetical protein